MCKDADFDTGIFTEGENSKEANYYENSNEHFYAYKSKCENVYVAVEVLQWKSS